MNRFDFVVRTVVAVSVLVLGSLARAGDGERWFTLDLGGTPAGYTRTERTTSDGVITSASEMVIRVARGEIEIEFRIDTVFEETEDGRPVSVRYVQDLGISKRETEWVFEGDQIVITENVGGRESTRTVAAPSGDWRPPGATARFVAERLAAGADSIDVATLDPGSGTAPITTTRSNIERVELTINGKTIEAYRCDVVSSAAPNAVSIEYLDASGESVKSSMSLGALSITMEEATEARALGRDLGAGAEIMVASFVKPSEPIRNPRRVTRAVYLIKATDGGAVEMPTLGPQSVEEIEAGVIRMEIDPAKHAEKSPTNIQAFLASTTLCEAGDEAVVELAERALKGFKGDDAARAERLRRAVYRHVSAKDLSVAFASAGETARSGVGDCTEHGVLLAAMLRAAGIPSRVVSGLVYADRFAGEREIFGYHMWTQALLPDERGEKHWVDLDATLPPAYAFDATHIAVSVSSLADDRPTGALIDTASVMGRIEIEVESVGYEKAR